MGQSLTVHVLDQATEERLNFLDVRLNPIGVPGEFRPARNQEGGFSFVEIPAGKYSLAVYDPHGHYASLYQKIDVDSAEDQLLSVRVTPGAFLCGRILDEEGRPPQRCRITLFRLGERFDKTGYINDSGDHPVAEDGQFRSPPLYPGRYMLRIAGVLQRPTTDSSADISPNALQRGCFDFLYPSSRTLEGATGFDIAIGELRSGLQIQIPCPVWHTVRGKVIGNLPLAKRHVSAMFAWDPGAIDPIGGSGGVRVQPDGTFELMLQPGHYSVEIWEFSTPEPSGRIRFVRSFGKTAVDVADGDLNGIEIFASAGN